MFKPILHVPAQIKAHLKGDTFDALMQLQGKAFRDVPGRKTMRVRIGEESYFIKQHIGVGWREIFKNLFSFKAPILGAMTEVRAIQKLTQIGIKTTPLVAYGQQGCSPASIKSFVLTEDLGDIVSLEEILIDSQTFGVNEQTKVTLMVAVANIAKKLHAAGLAHRDFYLCHFVLSRENALASNFDLQLIDLHRMLQNQSAGENAVMKDIAGLYFSMLQNGLNAQHLNIFKQHYLPQTDAFWTSVDARANQLLSKFNSTKFQQRLKKEKSAIR